MRAGWVVSFIGHVGFVIMTLLAWESRSSLPQNIGAVVPVEIVDVAAESNVRALAEDVPDEEVSPQEQPPSEEEPAPASTPAPTPPRPRQQNDTFDLSAVAGLLDKQREPGRERNEGQRADRNQRGAGLGTAEVAAMEDRLRALARAHISRNNCWRMPIDQPDPDRLVVTIQFDINRNGTLNGQPRVISPRNYTFDPAMRVAVDSALRAIRTCDPYPFADDPVVGDHYELWREMEYTFRPRL
ncbi:MAG: hypothetical protein ACT4OF_11970 [Caulobacteraceae bacterium]